MPRIIQIPGRSGFYLRVAVPRGKLRDALGTCDVVKKIGNTKEEAEEFINKPFMKEAVELRRIDDQAKVLNKETPNLEHFKNYLEQSLKN